MLNTPHPRKRLPASRSNSSLRRAIANCVEPLENRMLLSGAIQVTVLNDANNSGVKDAGDLPLAGWTVYIDENKNEQLDAGEASLVTNASGQALFDGLANGKTDVREILPAGWSPSPGFDTLLRVNVNNDQTTPAIFLNTSAPAVGSASGTVWNDINGDGIRDPEDVGISGWTVFIDLNTDRVHEASEPFAITDANGVYNIPNLAPGKYKVREITPGDWDPTLGFDGQNSVDITAGHTSITDFGNFNAASLGTLQGTVWNDVNADGVRAAGDPGLGGWTIFLDLNVSGSLDAGEQSTTTDASGNYSFPSVVVGTYHVAEVLQDGWNASPGHPTSVIVNVVNEGNARADFANFTPTLGSISGKVWNDANGDGTLNSTEPGIEGWTVFIDQDGDGALGASEPSAVTDAAGNYTLSSVAVGSSVVREIPAVGWTPTAPGTGSQLVVVQNATAVSNVNFGNKQRTDGAISGVVFFDANHNGARDAGERPLPGITVFLDANDNGTLDPGEASAVSAADLFYTPAIDETGTYSFTHLPAGPYHVRQIVPTVLSATPDAQRVHSFDLLVGEERNNVNFADVFRSNEIHGLVYDDANKNHTRDTGEAGLPGVEIYIDRNRDNVYQTTEPRTVTGADGTYSFSTDLTAGSYVVRELHHSGREHSYPTTTSGILWPTGVSNPASGNVTPTSITTSLAEDQTEHHTVSITLPGSGSISNKVDVFLLFDDTGSFTGNSPIVRAAFPQIISQLQTSMPTVDFGFGVGRFEEYANFGAEFATGRPFILNQPIVSADTPGFSAAIQSALDRTAPGYGGDQPETDIEALFQAATGRGFDGNNNGTTNDSGAAGLVSTQITPGDSGDVPSFGSFIVDPSGNVLPPSGSVGGAGFRPGALPIILLATDTGFAFQPTGATSITGLNGLTLPISALTQTSRPTTPFGSGANIQDTVTALNALGALVIGLGTNSTATLDPRQDLEALAKLTGAVNRSLTSIPNGTAVPIAPGEPLYFQISSGFSASVANGVVNAIENGASNVAVNIAIKASDPTVHLEAAPEVIHNVGAGQTATFDVTFEGDGRPHRFDLQFVREGTDVVLGSIPVVIGTPIQGDGYEYEDLDDGEIAETEDFGSWYNPLLPTNTAPTFSKGDDEATTAGAGAISLPGWATSISSGSASETDQALDFIVTADDPSLFAVAPSIAPDGTLSYTPAADASGTATITVRLHDSGGTEGGGIDTSAAQTFTIDIAGRPPLAITSNYDFLNRQALIIDFSADVAGITSSSLQAVNLATGLPAPVKTFNYDSTLHRATLTFDTASLTDGNYRLALAAGDLPTLATPYEYNFFVLHGDANHDRSVDFNDLVLLAQNYNTLSGRTWAQGDFTGDGAVDFNDLVMLAQRYNSTLPAPSPSAPAPALARVATASAPMPSLAAVIAQVSAPPKTRTPAPKPKPAKPLHKPAAKLTPAVQVTRAPGVFSTTRISKLKKPSDLFA